MSAVGERRRRLREEHGCTVREFADLIMKTPGYVSRIEGCREVPSPDLVCVIAEI
jgi:transcriptional regulator with XRE-family HTH domain